MLQQIVFCPKLCFYVTIWHHNCMPYFVVCSIIDAKWRQITPEFELCTRDCTWWTISRGERQLLTSVRSYAHAQIVCIHTQHMYIHIIILHTLSDSFFIHLTAMTALSYRTEMWFTLYYNYVHSFIVVFMSVLDCSCEKQTLLCFPHLYWVPISWTFNFSKFCRCLLRTEWQAVSW